ncbi:hypothetical protein F4811DRAFT_551522 [Daldinia bambusicola]|nr:hypothetical protein F4811DRAFT_551522 [Daldinia bambusicola]
MVRTGDDAHLSRPVSFERLVGEGKTTPLALKEGKLAKEFGVAMRFLFDLQAEEEATIPSLRQVSATLTEERERACHAWVESVLQYASLREVGVDGNGFTWEAVRRMPVFEDAATEATLEAGVQTRLEIPLAKSDIGGTIAQPATRAHRLCGLMI